MQLGYQFLDKETEGVGVCVYLTYCHVYFTIVTHTSKDLKKWVNTPLAHRVDLSLLAPFHVPKVGHVKERLVDVDDSAPLIH